MHLSNLIKVFSFWSVDTVILIVYYVNSYDPNRTVLVCRMIILPFHEVVFSIRLLQVNKLYDRILMI